MTNDQMTDVEMDLLGRAFAERLDAAVVPTGGADPLVTWARAHRRRRVRYGALGAAAVVAAVGAVAVPLTFTRPTSTDRTHVTASPPRTARPVATRPPAALQQAIRVVPIPPAFHVLVRFPTLPQTPTLLRAYSTDGGPALVVYRSNPLAPGRPQIGLSYDNEHPSSPYDGTPGVGGSGEADGNPVFVTPDYPAHGQQYYVWTFLPAGTAYVTYTYEGRLLAWEDAVDSTVALLTPRPAAFDSSYALARSATKGVLTAYDDAGRPLASHPGPYTFKDDGKTSL